MELQGRDLRVNMRGADVKLLHEELRKLGYADIPQDELSDQRFGAVTSRAVREFQERHGLEPTAVVDAATAARINAEVNEQLPFVVKGTIRLADESPATGLMVSAVDWDLRHEQKLGQSQTDKRGFYEIRYSHEQFSKREKDRPDLVVRVPGDDDTPLVESTWFNAPPVAEVNLIIPAEKRQPSSLFEKIKSAIEGLLDGLNPEELEENKQHRDVTFLSGETGFEMNSMARFVMAHKLGRIGIQAEFWFALLGGSFYEFTEEQSLEEQLKTTSERSPFARCSSSAQGAAPCV